MRHLRVIIVVTAVAGALAPIPPAFIERWYSRGLYAAAQPVITAASSVVPFALLDVAVCALVIGALITLVRRRRQLTAALWSRQTIMFVVMLAASGYLWFLLLWGFNYRRLPLERKLAYDQSRVTRDHALALGRVAVDRANGLALSSRDARADDRLTSEDDSLATAFAEVQRMLGAANQPRVAHPKRSLLTWYFRKAAIDGMTNPFFLEIIVTPDLLPFERPHTLAHEWAHLAGYADESEANFVAWLTCLRGSALARYSGWLFAYEHLSRTLARDDRRALREALTPPVVADLEASARRLARASPRISSAARGAYDTYLRANRIEEGIANYGVVVRLLLGTTFGPDWTPQLSR